MDLSEFNVPEDSRAVGGTLADLEDAERELPRLLRDGKDWNTLRIDYHPPIVCRLWRPWREGRLFLHLIRPCHPGEALVHPHPWPSAVRILSGTYHHITGTKRASPGGCRSILAAGSAYSITDPLVWHAVTPIGGIPSFSLMVTGKPWGHPDAIKPDRPLAGLSDLVTNEILARFREFYPVKT